MLRDAGPDRLSRIIELAPFSTLVTWLNCALLTIVLWPYVEPWRLAIWWMSVIAIGVMMFRVWHLNKGRTYRSISRHAVRASALNSAFVALPWALLLLLIVPSLPPFSQMLAYLVVAGMSAAGAMVLARAPLSSICYMLVTLMPMVIVNIGFLDAVHVLMAVFSVIYFLFLSLFVLQHAHIHLENEYGQRRLIEQMAQIDRSKQHMEHLARVDPITHLLNRNAFQQTLAEETTLIGEGHVASLTLFLLDLDYFKSVNDALGHHAGDLYLYETAQRIRVVAGAEHRLFRIGGDEFAVLAANIPFSAIPALGQRLLTALSQSVTINGHVLQGGASIGIAQAPHHTLAASELLTLADDALLEAKESGRGVMQMFDVARKDRIKDRAIEAEKLIRGIGDGQIVMAYQPQIHIPTGALLGFEALVRWDHPEKGILAPIHFLPLAEDKGFVLELCDAIMNRVHHDIRAWLTAGIDPGRIAINIHPLQLKHPDRFLKRLDAMVRDCDTAHRLTIEITEDCVVGRGTEAVPKILRGLLDRGINVSLDDFGTGFASLSHIKELPITELKIDRCFTSDMLSCEKNLSIVKAIYDMALPRRIEVVAEGIETAEQADALLRLGGTIGQGYHYARPMLVAEVNQALHSRRFEARPLPGAEAAVPAPAGPPHPRLRLLRA